MCKQGKVSEWVIMSGRHYYHPVRGVDDLIEHSDALECKWKSVRVVDRISLLRKQGVKALEGSNPSFSANRTKYRCDPLTLRVMGQCITLLTK